MQWMDWQSKNTEMIWVQQNDRRDTNSVQGTKVYPENSMINIINQTRAQVCCSGESQSYTHTYSHIQTDAEAHISKQHTHMHMCAQSASRWCTCGLRFTRGQDHIDPDHIPTLHHHIIPHYFIMTEGRDNGCEKRSLIAPWILHESDSLCSSQIIGYVL